MTYNNIAYSHRYRKKITEKGRTGARGQGGKGARRARGKGARRAKASCKDNKIIAQSE